MKEFTFRISAALNAECFLVAIKHQELANHTKTKPFVIKHQGIYTMADPFVIEHQGLASHTKAEPFIFEDFVSILLLNLDLFYTHCTRICILFTLDFFALVLFDHFHKYDANQTLQYMFSLR